MSIKLFIGGLSWNTDTDSLRSHFTQFGPVEDAIVIRDRETGRSRGFGFVTYASDEAANAAVAACDGQDFDGRTIRVQRAEQREGGSSRGPPSGGFRGGNGGQGGNGGYSRGGQGGW
jgi:cold-inducible RNA-binding protein